MNIIHFTYHWSMFIGAILITIGLGLIPLIRCIINNSDNIYKICFSIIVYVGIRLMIMPSVKELREAQKN